MSPVIFSRRQALATLVSATAFASPAKAGLIVGSNGPLIARAPGPVVSLERPQQVPRIPAPAEEAPAPVAAAKPRSDIAFSMPLLNANTGERVTAVFEIAGPAVVARYKAQLDWFFRDWRQNEM